MAGKNDLTRKQDRFRSETDEILRKRDRARGEARIGLWGILLGIVLLFVFWPLGILFILAGGLAALTNWMRARG